MAASQASSMHMFALPPPALPEPVDSSNSAPTASRGKKRRAAQQQPQPSAAVTLPPPPTRTRKIIQMKPTPPSASPASSSSPVSPSKTIAKPPPTKPKPAPKTAAPAPATTNTTTSRKVARKTAHSLIERRRRSKMNAEFEALKNLVPACRGVEMHKLAILQASIEYVRYLEGCVKELQKANGGNCCSPPPVFSPRNADDDEEDSEDEGEDVEMREEPQQQPCGSSGGGGGDGSRRGTEDYSNDTTAPSSAASVASDFTPVHSATTSPVFTHPAQGPRLPSISPMLFPQHQPPPCHSPMEATAGALLLLADEGRREDGRGSDRPVLSRGMSVKDLLSS